jgi:hypothetical protein
MAMTKMKIQSKTSVFEISINPASLKIEKNIRYKEFELHNASFGLVRYDAHTLSKLSFDFVLDSTGIAYKKNGPLDKTIATFEKIAYDINGNTHIPNVLKVSWGSFIFNCVLTSLSYDYSLFSPDGEPLRVKVSVSFIGIMSLEEAQKKANNNSPDMTHIITLKAGESIAMWCDKIYGDASYCIDIAQYNNLPGLRNILVGTKIVFPPLTR